MRDKVEQIDKLYQNNEKQVEFIYFDLKFISFPETNGNNKTRSTRKYKISMKLLN